MKVKRQHYESNNSLAITICLYSRDINFARGLAPAVYQTLAADDDIVNVLHALLTLARSQEVTNGPAAKSQKIRAN